MLNLFELTKKNTRHIGLMLYIAVIAGIFQHWLNRGLKD